MEITIDIENYISEDRIKQIAEEELRDAFRRNLELYKGVEAVLSDLTYDYVFKFVSEAFDGDLEQALKEQILERIMDGHTVFYEMFRQKSDWEREDGPCLPILKEECEKLRPLVYEMAKKHIEEYPFHELDYDEIQYEIGKVIMDALLEATEKE